MGNTWGRKVPLKEVLRKNKREINKAVRELDRELGRRGERLGGCRIERKISRARLALKNRAVAFERVQLTPVCHGTATLLLTID